MFKVEVENMSKIGTKAILNELDKMHTTLTKELGSKKYS